MFTVTMETKVWKVRYRNADYFGGRVSAEGFYCLIGPLGLAVDVWWSIKHVDNPLEIKWIETCLVFSFYFKKINLKFLSKLNISAQCKKKEKSYLILQTLRVDIQNNFTVLITYSIIPLRFS